MGLVGYCCALAPSAHAQPRRKAKVESRKENQLSFRSTSSRTSLQIAMWGATNDPLPQDTQAMSKPSFDITLPREAICQSFKGKPGLCPRCGGPLQQRSQTYLVATRRGRRT